MISFSVEAGSASHVGRVRSLNEDAFLASEPVFAVADGMGGHDAGEVASALAIVALSRLVGLRCDGDGRGRRRAGSEHCDQRIQQRVRVGPDPLTA